MNAVTTQSSAPGVGTSLTRVVNSKHAGLAKAGQTVNFASLLFQSDAASSPGQDLVSDTRKEKDDARADDASPANPDLTQAHTVNPLADMQYKANDLPQELQHTEQASGVGAPSTLMINLDADSVRAGLPKAERLIAPETTAGRWGESPDERPNAFSLPSHPPPDDNKTGPLDRQALDGLTLQPGKLAQGEQLDAAAQPSVGDGSSTPTTPSPAATGKVRIQSWRAGAALSSHVSTVKLAATTAQTSANASVQTATSPGSLLAPPFQQSIAESTSGGRTAFSSDSSTGTEGSLALVAMGPHQEARSGGGTSGQPSGNQPNGQSVFEVHHQEDQAARTDATASEPLPSFSELMNQLSEQLDAMASQGAQTANLTVDAGGPVPLDVQVTMDGGTVSVAFGSADSSTLHALKTQAETTLKSMLANQGMLLDQVSFDTQSGAGHAGTSNGQTSSGNPTSEDRRGGGGTRNKAPLMAEQTSHAVRRSATPGSNRVDLFA